MIRRDHLWVILLCAGALPCAAQVPPQIMPQAPQPRTISAPNVPVLSLARNNAARQNTAQQTGPLPPNQTLNLQQAEQIALQNHPRVQAAQNLATAAAQQLKEARAAYYPNTFGSVTGVLVGDPDDTRIGAGVVNSPRVFDKQADGLTVNQLVTDFGRTRNLVKSSNFHAQAQQEDVVTSRQDVLLQVDQAYFGVLKAQAELEVAQATVTQRQTVSQQITTMQQQLLKSTLDVAFANVDLAQAQLLLITAQNDVQASYAVLSAALGYADQRTFTLADVPLSPAPASDINALIQQALQNRPELVSARFESNAEQSYATAERDLYLPVVQAVGLAGLNPYYPGNDNFRSTYEIAGVNITIPIFNGHLFGSLKTEAQARATAQNQNLRDLQDAVVRDVREAWLNAQAGYQRLSVTQQLLDEAMMGLNLAQARYQIGLSSIVELTQSQVNLTQAQIANASAKYDYAAEIAALNYQIGVAP